MIRGRECRQNQTQSVLPLIDPRSITACKEVVVFPYHCAYSHSDIVLTGMCWERVGAAKTFVKLNPISIYTLIKTFPCSAQNDAERAQVSIKCMHHHYKQEEE